MMRLGLVLTGSAGSGVVAGVLASSLMGQDGWGLAARAAVGFVTGVVVGGGVLIAALARDG